MRAICLDNTVPISTPGSITIGKYYDVVSYHENDRYYMLRNDKGISIFMYKSAFKLVEDIRNEKLKQLGI